MSAACGRSEAAGAASAYRITSEDQLLSGEYADGRISDLMMENDRIAVVIGAIGHAEYNARSGGNILDACPQNVRLDALAQVYTHFDDDWPRQAVYDSIEIIDSGAGGGSAVVRAYGKDLVDSTLRVVTEYTLEAGSDQVMIATKVINRGDSVHNSFDLGDAIAFFDSKKYVPGYGFSLPGTVGAAWIAGTSGLVSYGYVGPDTSVTWGTQGGAWFHLNLKVANLSPGDSSTYVRYLIVSGPDIGSVATSAHQIRGTPVGTLSCTVIDRSDSMPLLRATIDAYDAVGAPYLQMRTDSKGRTLATLPPGDWLLVAAAERYLSSETWLSVPSGESIGRDFTLDRDKSIPPRGDTLTVIQRPLLNIPAFVVPGGTLTIECEAGPATSGWAAELLRNQARVPLEISSSTYDPTTLWWTLSAVVPDVLAHQLYDLAVTANGGIEDTTRHAVRVISAYKEDYYFIHITDTHLPTHRFSSDGWVPDDTSEILDLREVISDINIINPEFVLLTGDLINEGELEDYLDARYYTRAQQLLTEFEVPVFLIAGNHDLGGWESTPPSNGTARRDWWKFFGWRRLASPPPGAPHYTQNYSFDYGPVHYVALEAYDNYDMWRSEIYGRDSFTPGQIEWLGDDLAEASGSAAQVLFYHYDFSGQINLRALGVEMALWGHIHRDSGNLSAQPYNLSTNNLCDGERSYRLVRVSDATLLPSPTISAGYDGANLDVEFDPANDGTHYEVTADVTNNLSERFEHALVRFVMPEVCDSVDLEGGTLLRIEDLGSKAIYHVGVDIRPMASQTVTLTTTPDQPGPSAELQLWPNHPNPFRSGTILSFTIPRSGSARLAVYDVRGREVAVLVNRHLPAGEHKADWNGRDRHNNSVSPGVYFARLAFADEARARKIVLTR